MRSFDQAQIEIASSADVLQLEALFKRMSPLAKSDIKEWLGSETKIIIKATIHNKIVGYLGMKQREVNPIHSKQIDFNMNAHIAWIAVDPDFQGARLGRRLILKAQNIAKDWGKKGIWLDCRFKRLSFYTQLGFTVVFEAKREDGETQYYVMQRFALPSVMLAGAKNPR